MQEEAEHAISIDGGIVEQGISEEPKKNPQPIPVKSTRVNGIIPYEQREKTKYFSKNLQNDFTFLL